MADKGSKTKRVGTIATILLLLSLILAGLNLDGRLYDLIGDCTLSKLSYVCSDHNGGVYVIDSSGYRVLHLDENKRVSAAIPGQSTAEDSFFHANAICSDDDGNVYVHSKEISTQSNFQISAEYIRKFSPEGKYLDTPVTMVHKIQPMKCSVIRIQCVGNELYYYTLAEAGIWMHRAGDDNESRLFAWPEAYVYVRDVHYRADEDALYIITFRGQVGRIDADGQFELLYDAPATDALSVPWYLTSDEQGTIYVCDIGYRTINTLTEDGYRFHFFSYDYITQYDPEARHDSYAEYVADFSDGFLTANSDELIWEENGEICVASSLEYTSAARRSAVLFWIGAGIGAAALAVLLVIGMIFIVRNHSQDVKMVAVVIGLTLGTACLFVALTFGNFNERLLEGVYQRENTMALMLNNTLPEDAFRGLDGLDSYNGEDYQRVKQAVDALFINEDGNVGDLYCVLYSINDGVITNRYTLEEAYGVNYPYDWEYVDSDEAEIITTGEKKFYSALNTTEGNFMFVLNPLFGDDGSVIGLIEIGTDLTAFTEENNALLRDLLVNIIVMSVMVTMLAIEVIAFINNRKRLKQALKAGAADMVRSERVNLFRLVVFLIFFLTNITTSFLATYALRQATTEAGAWNIPPEIMAAMPISAEVLTGALFSFFGSGIIRRMGKRNAGILGSVLFTVGLCVRFIYPRLWLLTLGNAIQGCGWGIVLLIINTMIAEQTDEKMVDAGFVNYNSAMQNGLNSGIVLGGFLVRWISYQQILVVVAVLSVLVLFVAMRYLTNEQESQEEEEEAGSIGLWRFLLKPRVLLYFIGIVVPVIAASYYLNYLYPIIGADLGMNETYLGYSYLLNGLVSICFAKVLMKKLSDRVNRPLVLLIASAIYFVTFSMVAAWQNVPALLAALILLGLSDSFGYATQTAYYSELKEVKQFGYSRAMGVYSLFENFSQTIGSFLFGYVLVVGLGKGLFLFGAVIMVMAVVFTLGTMVLRKKN